jgi:hypothetical protein
MRCKKAIDARAYSHEMLEQMRRDSVQRVEKGESPKGRGAGLGDQPSNASRFPVHRPSRRRT